MGENMCQNGGLRLAYAPFNYEAEALRVYKSLNCTPVLASDDSSEEAAIDCLMHEDMLESQEMQSFFEIHPNELDVTASIAAQDQMLSFKDEYTDFFEMSPSDLINLDHQI